MSVSKITSMLEKAIETTPTLSPRQAAGGPTRFARDPSEFSNRRLIVLRSGQAPDLPGVAGGCERGALQTRRLYLGRQLVGTPPRGRKDLSLGQPFPRGLMPCEGDLVHHQIKRHPLRWLHTHKHRSEQRTHQPRSGVLQPRHLELRPAFHLGEPLPVHRQQPSSRSS
ncbi:hypothetical protein ACWDKQ_32790 [Saccharopolyspora sp. NPDC000995]